MPASPEGQRALPLARNLEALGGRLARVRVPHAPGAGRRRRQALAAAAVLAGALILLFLLTIDGHAPAWQRGMPDVVGRGFEAVTDLARSHWLLVPSGVACLALLLADWDRTSRRIAAAWTELGDLLAFVFVAVAAAGMTTNVVKWSLGRSRPILFDGDGPFALTPISFDHAHVSFPSGHATTAAAVATALVLIFPGRASLRVAAVLFAVVIALSRVMVGAHYPSDVVAGLFIGAVVTFAVAHAFGRRGIAFQGQADGSLRPKTVALRRFVPAPGGAIRGLGAAWAGAFRPRRRPAVDKPRRG